MRSLPLQPSNFSIVKDIYSLNISYLAK